MNKKEIARKVIWWVVYALLLAGTVVAFVFTNQIWGTNAVFNNVVSDNPILQYLYQDAIRNSIRTVQIIVIAIALWYLIALLAKITFHTKKGVTISKLLLNFAKWVIAIGSIFFIMAAWGANATFMLASAGVVTLIIGLGSQALVADILAGVFIVFEGDFQVGDIVVIDGWRGEVQAIGIRTTKLIDAGGNVKIISNNEIKSIINQTQELSLAKCYVGIPYSERIEKVEAIIADNMDKIKEKIPAIVEGPYYKGVSELGESSVNLLFLAKCKEDDIYQVQRDLNRAIKIMFDDNGISIPFNQLDVHLVKDEQPSGTLTKKTVKKAEQFVDEQREASSDVDDREEE